jgi:hypothetical protein
MALSSNLSPKTKTKKVCNSSGRLHSLKSTDIETPDGDYSGDSAEFMNDKFP